MPKNKGAQIPERAAAPVQETSRSTQRKRPKATHGDERGRETRAQEGRSELFERVDEDAEYVKPTSLEAPLPRPGYKQRWVRVGLAGNPDEKNLARKLREGWRARASNTVPKGFHVPTMKHGDFAGTIMVEGMLLCEIPVKMAQKRQKFMRDQTDIKTRAVNENLMRVNEGAGGGFGPIRKGEKSQVADAAQIKDVRREVRKTMTGGVPTEEEVDLT